MNNCRLMSSALLIALTCLFVGCAKTENEMRATDLKEREGDLFKEAYELQREGKFLEAREKYGELVVLDMMNAEARLNYAILLQDVPPTDTYLALSHYEAFLKLHEHSEKKGLVEERIQKARKQISNRFDETKLEDKQKQIDQLYVRLRQVNIENERLRAEIEKQEKLLKKKEKEYEDEVKRTEKYKKMVDTFSNGGEVVPSSVVGNRTYRIRKGDTLWSIARDVYGDSSRNVEIAAANGIKAGDALVEGKEIIIP